MRQRNLGLSLLEMLVTLLVAGLALLLLTQAIGQYQRAQSSVLQFERAGREYRLSETWWRASVEGLQALDGAALQGDGKGFTGITLSPVVALQGTPAQQTWQAVFANDGGWGLALEEMGRSIVLPLNKANDPTFRYLDREGEWHDAWPPALGKHPALPAAIALHLGAGSATDREQVMVAAIAGSKDPVYVQYEPGDL